MRIIPCGTLLVVMTAAGLLAQPSKAFAGPPAEVTFAQTTKGNWALRAKTEVYGRDTAVPTVKEISCSISTNGLSVFLTRTGKISLSIRGTDQKSQGNHDFGVLNVTEIDIGSVRYATKGIEFGHAPTEFSDVEYSHSENDIVTSSFIGYMAFQRHAKSPWLNIDTLLDNMIAADQMAVSYRVWNGDAANTWHLNEAVIPLQGLGAAVSWCETQFVSPNAFRLDAGK